MTPKKKKQTIISIVLILVIGFSASYSMTIDPYIEMHVLEDKNTSDYIEYLEADEKGVCKNFMFRG